MNITKYILVPCKNNYDNRLALQIKETIYKETETISNETFTPHIYFPVT